MESIKHVSLFEDRHYVPNYVHDAVFPGKKAYHVRDRELLRSTAYNSLSKWKKQGVTSVYVYLSGLNTAVRALEAAAWKLKIYLRIYEYSYVQDEWLPDTLEPFESILPHPFTDREKELWENENKLRKTFSGKEEYVHLFYVGVYNDIRQMQRDKPSLSWEEVHSYITDTYVNPCWELINMMKIHLFPDGYKELPKEGYHERVRRTIISWRGKHYLGIPNQKTQTYTKKTEPRNETKGQRLDRLISQAAKRRRGR